jgi:predicted anti-sigma-YlaC factor YlaD
MISCEVVSDLMPVYASGEASAETRQLVEEHLARCPACREAFGKDSHVEEALSELGEAQEPANGRRFIHRTRRLLFAVGSGAVLLFGCLLAGSKWVILEGMALTTIISRGISDVLALGATLVVLLAAYLALLVWRSRRAGWTRRRDIVVSVVGAVLLTMLTFIAFELLSGGVIMAGALALSLVVAALAVTFVLLPRAPYMTVGALLALVVVSGLLLGQTVVGIVSLSDFTLEWPASLGHPQAGITPEDAVVVDLSPLGLEFVERSEVDAVNGLAIGSQSAAIQATYEGEDSLVVLTVVEFEAQREADRFFSSWGSRACRIGISSFEVNMSGLLGQGQIKRCYNPQTGRAYNAWQTEGWATIVEVAGQHSEAGRLAREVKSLVSASYLTAGQD